MQINRTTDYALRMLVYLGKKNRVVPSSEMANSMGISQRYLLSIAKELKDHGYIKVGFGPDGGYSIAKALNRITLFDVIVLMEGTIIISRCLTQEKHCEGRPCVLHNAYGFLQSIMECYLRSLTIDMLVGQPADTWQKIIIGKIDEACFQSLNQKLDPNNSRCISFGL